MGYYQGDLYAMRSQMRRAGLYRGDYYAGDPFFGGLLKTAGGLFKKAVGALTGFGGGGGATKVIQALPAGAGKLGKLKAVGGKVLGTVKKHPVLSAAGAAGAAAGMGGAVAELIEGGHRKRRRMNVYNPRALRRAVRRAHGFAKMARRVLHIEKRFKNPKRWGHMGHFPKKRKRRA